MQTISKLQPFCNHFATILQTFCKHFANILQTFCKHFANAFCAHFVCILFANCESIFFAFCLQKIIICPNPVCVRFSDNTSIGGDILEEKRKPSRRLDPQGVGGLKQSDLKFNFLIFQPASTRKGALRTSESDSPCETVPESRFIIQIRCLQASFVTDF